LLRARLGKLAGAQIELLLQLQGGSTFLAPLRGLAVRLRAQRPSRLRLHAPRLAA